MCYYFFQNVKFCSRTTPAFLCRCDLAGANSVSAGSSLSPNEKYEYKPLIAKWSMVAEDQQIGDLIFTSI